LKERLPGRAMAQAVSRRPPIAEARVRSRGHSMWDLWWTKWHLHRFLPEFFGFFPCQFYSTSAPLLGKVQKIIIIFIFITGLHNKQASWLQCVRSVCCGALHHKRKKKRLPSSPITLRTEGGFLSRLKIAFSWLPNVGRKAGAHTHSSHKR
jgi:hypothetical protein